MISKTLLIPLAVAVALVPHVYVFVETAAEVFPVPEGVIEFVDLEFIWWFRAPFIAAHACVAWLGARMWRGNAALPERILTLTILGEMAALYATVLRFWAGGISVPLY